jgi:hypothetical protein
MTYVPHPTRLRIAARWGWMCSCGVKTVHLTRTKREARAHWKKHLEKMR